MTHRYPKLLFFLSLSLIVGVNGVLTAQATKVGWVNHTSQSGSTSAVNMQRNSPSQGSGFRDQRSTVGGVARAGKSDTVKSAQQKDSLSLTEPFTDPLLPQTKVTRPLSPLEIGTIQREIERLEQQGQELWQAGAGDRAFALWWRQLRLQQVLSDRIAEVESLGRIGAIAWENNRVAEARAILARLQVIETTAFPENYQLLLPLAEAYQQLRESDAAIALYQQQVDRLDAPYKPEILRVIAQLALDWFDDAQALAAYEQIQTLNALTDGDRQQLAQLYERLNQPTQAIQLYRELTPQYFQTQNFEQLILTYQKIAQNYHQLEQYSAAIDFSKNAFTLAWELQYFDAAAAALTTLAELYLAQDQTAFAIQVYEQLLTVQNSSYNRFGMMQTYDKLGHLYQQTAQYPEALISFQQGLAIAKTLNHDIQYFTQAIEALPLVETNELIPQ